MANNTAKSLVFDETTSRSPTQVASPLELFNYMVFHASSILLLERVETMAAQGDQKKESLSKEEQSVQKTKPTKKKKRSTRKNRSHNSKSDDEEYIADETQSHPSIPLSSRRRRSPRTAHSLRLTVRKCKRQSQCKTAATLKTKRLKKANISTREECDGARMTAYQRSIVRDWLQKHWNHPYPTRAQLDHLMRKTGCSRRQIHNNLYYSRKIMRRGATAGTDSEPDFQGDRN